MSEIQMNPGEYDKRPIWLDLVDIEKSINEDVRKTYVNGFYNVPREVIVKKLREKYEWKKKWMIMSRASRTRWAEALMKDDIKNSGLSKKLFDIKKYEELADKYFEEAGGVSKEGVVDALKKVENDTIKNVLRELGGLSGELEKGRNITKIVNDFIIILNSLREEARLYNFSEEELWVLNSIDEDGLKVNQDESELTSLLINYINKLESIILSKKKSV